MSKRRPLGHGACKRRPSAAVTSLKSPKRKQPQSGNLLDTFAALRRDLLAVNRSVYDLLYWMEERDDVRERVDNLLTHMRGEAHRIEGEVRAFGQIQKKWQDHIAGKDRPGPRTQSQQIAAVSSLCRNATGELVEFGHACVPLPQPSVDGLKMQVSKKMKLEHPLQVRVAKETDGAADLDDKDPLPNPKVTKILRKTGVLEVKLHYPLRMSVSPASVQLLNIEVIACQAWEGENGGSNAMESVRANLSAMLKDLTHMRADPRRGKRILKLSWTGRADKDSVCHDDGLLRSQHGYWDAVLQIRDVSATSGRSQHGALLFEAVGGELGVAVLAGGAGLSVLQEEAAKVPCVIVTQALTGNHLFDLDAAADDSVRSIGDKIRSRLCDETSEFKFLNKAGVVVDDSVKAKAINEYEHPSVPVIDDGEPRRLLMLEFKNKLHEDPQVAAAGLALPQAKAKAKSKGKTTVKNQEKFGLACIDDYSECAIVLTKCCADAHRLVEVLAQSRPEFHEKSLIELYRMKTVAEMFGPWNPRKHRVLKAGEVLKPGLFR